MARAKTAGEKINGTTETIEAALKKQSQVADVAAFLLDRAIERLSGSRQDDAARPLLVRARGYVLRDPGNFGLEIIESI